MLSAFSCCGLSEAVKYRSMCAQLLWSGRKSTSMKRMNAQHVTWRLGVLPTMLQIPFILAVSFSAAPSSSASIMFLQLVTASWAALWDSPPKWRTSSPVKTSMGWCTTLQSMKERTGTMVIRNGASMVAAHARRMIWRDTQKRDHFFRAFHIIKLHSTAAAHWMHTPITSTTYTCTRTFAITASDNILVYASHASGSLNVLSR
mmetsp:Transcript_13324/g.39937  ORF Transcript_13324/g.39937 Transcript_13324/m.39937 type:complete len:203 (-) Transcript_13324:193-801(-)